MEVRAPASHAAPPFTHSLSSRSVLQACEQLIIVETGPTGIELHITPPGGGEAIVIASRSDAPGCRMASIIAQLHTLPHAVLKRRAEDGEWKDRWSLGFYITALSLKLHRECAEVAARSPPAPPPPPPPPPTSPAELAPCLHGFGLPARAATLRALQPGGWLAKRYDIGLPWPMLCTALGGSPLPTENHAPDNAYKARRPKNGKVRQSHTTRQAAARPKRCIAELKYY